jgi:hypothetical protein
MSERAGEGVEPVAAPGTPPETYADRLVQQGRSHEAQQGLRPYRSGATRAKVLVALLWISFASSVIACAMNVWGWLTIESFLAGGATIEDLESFDVAFGGYAFVEIGIFIATAVAWLAWQYRTIDNEAPLGIGPSPWRPAVSVIWWFVPFANLVQPYRIHRDVWRRHLGANGSALVLVWWITWIVSSIVSNIAGRIWLVVETLDTIQVGLIVWLVADILTAISALPAIALVNRIQRGADALAATPPQVIQEPAPPPIAAT